MGNGEQNIIIVDSDDDENVNLIHDKKKAELEQISESKSFGEIVDDSIMEEHNCLCLKVQVVVKNILIDVPIDIVDENGETR